MPLLGSFAALMLAEEHGAARLVTFMLVVTMSDTGGLVGGVLLGKHPMAPMISPKKSWEGFAGSMLFGVGRGDADGGLRAATSRSGWASSSGSAWSWSAPAAT